MLSRLFDVLRAPPSPLAAAAVGASLLATGMSAAPAYLPTPAQDRLPAAALNTATAQEVAQLTKLHDLTAEQARLWNASVPATSGAEPAARPFFLPASGTLSQLRASDCLTAAVYYEAGQESLEGQRAVAQVVLNRLRHPAFPKTVCGVVFQGSERPTGCQFTFTCDGSLLRAPSRAGWDRARAVADAALNGYVERRVGRATHYHADYVVPHWSDELAKIATVGGHIFYRWSGRSGPLPALGEAYAGGEDDRVAERMPPDLVSPVRVEVEADPVLQAAVPAEPGVEPVARAADAPEVVQDVVAQAADSAANLTALTPAEAYRARVQTERETRAAMPASLF